MDASLNDLAERLRRVEDTLEIQQLAIRYAMAVDERNIDAWLEMFVPDVCIGRGLTGREALRDFIVPQVKLFYRSIHQIVGHRIELISCERATGAVYCRAEHEVGDRWIVIAIRYDDEYRRVGDDWLFTRRRERHWYAADLTERPPLVGFDSWHTAGEAPSLPGHERSWASFWSARDTSGVTGAPVPR